MRIGIFTNNYLPRISGVAHSVENFKKRLEKLGHKVYIFAPEYKKGKEELNVFRFKSIRLPQEAGPFHYPLVVPYSLKIKKIIQNLNLDIIHSQHPYLLGKTAKDLCQEFKIPLVFTNHTLYHKYLDLLPFKAIKFPKPYILKAVVKYANQSNLVIVPNKGIEKILRKAGLKTPISIIPSGIGLKKFKPARIGQIRKKYGFQKNDILLLIVTRLSYEKNIDFLIKAFAKIASSRENCYLLIIGDGLMRKKLEDLTKSLGLKKRVIFAGEIDYHKLPPYYQSADIFVYSSLIDSQALVLLEAMAAGLPIIAINEAVGPRELIKDGETGFLTENDQNEFAGAILKLIDNQILRKTMAEKAKKEAEKYSIETATEKLVKAYKSVLKPGSKKYDK